MKKTDSRPRGWLNSSIRSRQLLTSIAAVLLLCLVVTGPTLAAHSNTAAPVGDVSQSKYQEFDVSVTGDDTEPSVAEPRGFETRNPETHETMSVDPVIPVISEADRVDGVQRDGSERSSTQWRGVWEQARFDIDAVSSTDRLDATSEDFASTTMVERVQSIEKAGSYIGTTEEQYLRELLIVSALMNGLMVLFLFLSRFTMDNVFRLFRSGGEDDALIQESSRQVEPEAADSNEAPRSDEAVVRQLLEEHDGQMRQSNIVEATDWSKAKVSRLLGDMADNGEIVKVPLGRQNLVCLDGMEPEIAKPLP